MELEVYNFSLRVTIEETHIKKYLYDVLKQYSTTNTFKLADKEALLCISANLLRNHGGRYTRFIPLQYFKSPIHVSWYTHSRINLLLDALVALGYAYFREVAMTSYDRCFGTTKRVYMATSSNPVIQNKSKIKLYWVGYDD